MHASIVVLSALVAVATGQYWSSPWGMPINPALGVPFDEPAVHMGKVFNAQQHAMRGGMTYVVRKRREAAAPEAPATPAAPAAAEDGGTQPGKRQVLAYSGLGYAGLGYTGFGGWGSPYLGYGYNSYPYLFRKRRDVSEESPAAEQASMEDSPKDKRQIGLWGGYGYGGLYNPYMRSIYGGYPYLFRKRRDTSETEAPEQQAPMEDQSRDKRQYFGLGYGTWGYPTMYSGVYSPWGRSALPLWRKRRDTDSQAAPEDSAASEEDRNKRQILAGYPLAYSAYSAYNPYMAGYGYGRLGYSHWY